MQVTITATKFLDDYGDMLEASSFSKMHSTKTGVSVSDLGSRARAWRETMKALRAAGVDDGTILSKITEILAIILKLLPDIAAIILAVMGLFGKGAKTVPAPKPA